jgi:methylmalonyl-CoA/ethylmalonyl-CoA epimerase
MKIDHLGIATRGIDEALAFWRDALGLEHVHTETVDDQKVRVAMLPIGESRVELLEPTSEDSPISNFLEKRGGGTAPRRSSRSGHKRGPRTAEIARCEAN